MKLVIGCFFRWGVRNARCVISKEGCSLDAPGIVEDTTAFAMVLERIRCEMRNKIMEYV